jgi:hypothetical protein
MLLSFLVFDHRDPELQRRYAGTSEPLRGRLYGFVRET